MDAFRLILAIGPVAIYLLLLGTINFSRRALLVSGGRDAAVLALTLTGMLIVGPFELFLPRPTVVHYGPYVWVLVLGFYALCVTMGILMLRPRLVIYNISVDKLRPILAETVSRLDNEARWAGDSLVLPNLGMQLCIDYFRPMLNVSLKSVGANQNLHGWRQLERALGWALSREEAARHLRGLAFLSAGLLVLGGLATVIAHDPQAVTQALTNLVETLLQSMSGY